MKNKGLPADKTPEILCLCLSIILVLVYPLSGSYGREPQKKSVRAKTLRIEVQPHDIMPGDAFLIRINGGKGLPEASLKGKRLLFSRCGEDCFIAVGALKIETRPGYYRIKLKIGRKRINKPLFVKRVRFPTVRLTLSEEKVSLSHDALQRAGEEERLLKSIWQGESERLWEGGFSLPLENEPSTPFGVRRVINGKKISVHKGIDIKGKDGDEVKASNKGRVVLTEELFFGGNTLILDHGTGIYTVYMHLSGFKASPGDIVSKGAVIGFVGSSGRASGPHLHFGIKVQDITANPFSVVDLEL